MSNLVKNNGVFFTSIGSLVVASLVEISLFSKKAGFENMNPVHNLALDKFFYLITQLGNGWCMIIVSALYLILKRKKLAFLIFSSFLLSGVIAQVLKYFIPEARPAMILDKSQYPYFIDHVTLHSYSSFPSGHTASAFAMATVISFYLPDKWWSVPLLLYAVLVGYSRIYLGNHFLIDVLSGLIIGVISSVFCWLVIKGRSSDTFKISKQVM